MTFHLRNSSFIFYANAAHKSLFCVLLAVHFQTNKVFFFLNLRFILVPCNALVTDFLILDLMLDLYLVTKFGRFVKSFKIQLTTF